MSFRWPLDKINISQGFGGDPAFYKQYGQNGHNGIDLAAPAGTPVFAADEGTIAFEGWGKSGAAGLAGWMGDPAGICIVINNGGLYSGYAHLASTTVNKGQRVNKGQLIGYVGSTGAATGPHLHFEVIPLNPNFSNGFAGRINPTPYIETATNATDDQIRQAYREILEREADAAGLTHYRNYPIDFVRNDLAASQEKRNLDARKAEAARVAAEQAAKRAKEAEEAATKAAQLKAAQEAAKKAAEALAVAQAEKDRIAEEDRKAREAAEAKAKAQKDIEDKALEGKIATNQEQLAALEKAADDASALAAKVSDSEVAAEIIAGVSKRTRLIIYIVGDTLIGLAVIIPSLVLVFTSPDILIQATALSTTFAAAGGFLLTMFGIYKSNQK